MIRKFILIKWGYRLNGLNPHCLTFYLLQYFISYTQPVCSMQPRRDLNRNIFLTFSICNVCETDHIIYVAVFYMSICSTFSFLCFQCRMRVFGHVLHSLPKSNLRFSLNLAAFYGLICALSVQCLCRYNLQRLTCGFIIV